MYQEVLTKIVEANQSTDESKSALRVFELISVYQLQFQFLEIQLLEWNRGDEDSVIMSLNHSYFLNCWTNEGW